MELLKRAGRHWMDFRLALSQKIWNRFHRFHLKPRMPRLVSFGSTSPQTPFKDRYSASLASLAWAPHFGTLSGFSPQEMPRLFPSTGGLMTPDPTGPQQDPTGPNGTQRDPTQNGCSSLQLRVPHCLAKVHEPKRRRPAPETRGVYSVKIRWQDMARYGNIWQNMASTQVLEASTCASRSSSQNVPRPWVCSHGSMSSNQTY